MTVLFCDVVADGPADPEALRRVLERSLELMTAAVGRHGGTVEKFVGGGLMAVFGVPAVHEDDALRALRAAVEIRDVLPAHGLQARIGVQSGEVITGGAGPVTGVAVAVAKRLEEAAAAGEVLIGELTLALAAPGCQVEPVEPLQLRSDASRCRRSGSWACTRRPSATTGCASSAASASSPCSARRGSA